MFLKLFFTFYLQYTNHQPVIKLKINQPKAKNQHSEYPKNQDTSNYNITFRTQRTKTSPIHIATY